MPEELSAVLDAAQDVAPPETLLGREFRRATIEGTEVMLVLTGVGKVAAAATAALLAQRVDSAIMVGTAGGLGAGVSTGDVVVATQLLQHDFSAFPLRPRWEIPSLGTARVACDPTLTAALEAAATDVVSRAGSKSTRHSGLLLSGDQFIASSQAAQQLRTDHPDALAVDMESAAVAQVFHDAQIPFAVARWISDQADSEAPGDFQEFINNTAAPYAHALVVSALTRLAFVS